MVLSTHYCGHGQLALRVHSLLNWNMSWLQRRRGISLFVSIFLSRDLIYHGFFSSFLWERSHAERTHGNNIIANNMYFILIQQRNLLLRVDIKGIQKSKHISAGNSNIKNSSHHRQDKSQEEMMVSNKRVMNSIHFLFSWRWVSQATFVSPYDVGKKMRRSHEDKK